MVREFKIQIVRDPFRSTACVPSEQVLREFVRVVWQVTLAIFVGLERGFKRITQIDEPVEEIPGAGFDPVRSQCVAFRGELIAHIGK